jgi:hypothetical protein
VRRVESSRCRWDLSLPIRLRCTVRPDSESSHASFLVVTAGALGTDVVLMALRMEKESNNLQKDAKTYLDSMRGENEAVLTGPAMHPYPIPSASRLSRLCDPPPAHSRSHGIVSDPYRRNHRLVLHRRPSERREFGVALHRPGDRRSL